MLDKDNVLQYLLNTQNMLLAQASMASQEIAVQLYAKAAFIKVMFDLVIDGQFDLAGSETLN